MRKVLELAVEIIQKPGHQKPSMPSEINCGCQEIKCFQKPVESKKGYLSTWRCLNLDESIQSLLEKVVWIFINSIFGHEATDRCNSLANPYLDEAFKRRYQTICGYFKWLRWSEIYGSNFGEVLRHSEIISMR